MTQAGETYYAEDGTVSTVLEDVYDPDYEPTQHEIEEYARFLGVEPATEPELCWLGRAGLKEPMPKEWKPCKTDTGDVYYFNFETGESIWDHPMDEVFKARVVSERLKLKREGKNYKPPPEATPSVKSKAATDGATKKKATAGKTDKKLAEVEAKLANGPSSASSFAAPLTSTLNPIGASKIPLATTKLNALSAAGPSSLVTSSGATSSALKPLTTGGLPTTFGATSGALSAVRTAASASANGSATATVGGAFFGANAAKEAEKRIRERLSADFESKLSAVKKQNDEEASELEDELTEKLKKVERDFRAQIDDEKDTAHRAAERKHKRELQEYEETLEQQREKLRRDLRTTKEQVDEAEVEVLHSAKNTEREVAAKTEELRKKNEAEVTKRRLEIHEAWRKEKESAEAKAQAEVDAINANFESEKRAVEAKEALAYNKRFEEDEADMQEDLTKLKARLAQQKREAMAEIQSSAAASGQTRSAAYTEAERSYEETVSAAKKKVEETYTAERTRHQSQMATLRTEHAENLRSAAADAAARQSEGAASAIRSAKETSELAVAAVEKQLKEEREEELNRIDEETRQAVARAREEASGRLQGEAAASNSKIERARAAAETAAEEEVSAAKLRHQRELRALEEEVSEAQISLKLSSSSSAASPNSVNADPFEVDAIFNKLKIEWLSTHPSDPLSPLPTLPPAMQPSQFDTGLSDAHKAEVAAAVAEEKARLKAEADVAVATLQLQLERENANALAEVKRRAEELLTNRVEALRARLSSELKAETDELMRKITAASDAAATNNNSSMGKKITTASVSSAAGAQRREQRIAKRAAARESRQVAKMLRRKQLRDSIEEKHRTELIAREAEINRRVEEESHRLQQRLDALMTQLARDPQGNMNSTPPIPSLAMDSRPVTPERQHSSSFNNNFHSASHQHVHHHLNNFSQSFASSGPQNAVSRPPLAPAILQSVQSVGMGVGGPNPQLSSSGGFNNSGGLVASEHNTPVRVSSGVFFSSIGQPSASFGRGEGGLFNSSGNFPSAANFSSSSGPNTSNPSSMPVFPFSQHQQQPVQYQDPNNGGGSNTAPPPLQHSSSSIGERLAKAREVLRKKKKDLKARQDQLESARADWRIDMAAAKHNKDAAAIEVLMRIKKQMEGVAHQLNDETRDLLSAVEWLKEQEEAEGKRRAAAAKYAGSSKKFTDPMPFGANSSDGPLSMLAAGNAPTPDVNQLLVALAQQALSIEKRLDGAGIGAASSGNGNSNAHARSSSGSKKRRDEEEADNDPITSKWSSWLKENGGRDGGGGGGGRDGGGGGKDVRSPPRLSNTKTSSMKKKSHEPFDDDFDYGQYGGGGNNVGGKRLASPSRRHLIESDRRKKENGRGERGTGDSDDKRRGGGGTAGYPSTRPSSAMAVLDKGGSSIGGGPSLQVSGVGQHLNAWLSEQLTY